MYKIYNKCLTKVRYHQIMYKNLLEALTIKNAYSVFVFFVIFKLFTLVRKGILYKLQLWLR